MNDPSSPLLGLSVEQFMIAYQAGELAGLEGQSLLACPYLDDSSRLRVWMLGYLDQPIDSRIDRQGGIDPAGQHPLG